MFTPTYGRFSAPVDFMWMRLEDSKAISFAPNYSVDGKLNFSITTPKVNYLLVNNPKIKIYGTAGPRFWHLGTTLDLTPTIGGRPLQGVNLDRFCYGRQIQPASWLEGIGRRARRCGRGRRNPGLPGRRFLNYQFKPKWTLQGGWRYLTVHYGNNGDLFNGTIQGIAFGATYKFK